MVAYILFISDILTLVQFFFDAKDYFKNIVGRHN